MLKKEECEYCVEEKPKCLSGGKGFGDDEYSEVVGNTIEIEQWVGAFTSSPEQITMQIEINYCPKCGRHLNHRN